MRYEEIRCRVCGSERLEKQNDGTYVCKHCRSRFCENDLEEYKKTIRSELRGVVTEALVCQRAQDIANIRRNLFEALQEEYADSYKIIGYCRDLKRLLPNDFQANCFEALNNGGKKEVNAMLGSVDEKGAGRFYVKDILEFMVKSLMPANLLPLKSLAERALKDEEKTEYLNKIEEEAGKCEAGLYSPEVPRKAFIAYSSKDMAIVTPLVEYLENAGISCFVALRNMRHGRKAVDNYDKILQRAMHNCKSFVLVSTRNSRRFDCDAIEKELPYVRDKEPNVKRIEYLVEDYGENEGAIKSTLKDFFGGSEWVRNLEDLPSRIMDIKPQAVKYCLSCGEENPMNVNFCGQCGKRDFGTKEEYEARQEELKCQEAERREIERKELKRREEAQREAGRKETERRKVECRETEKKAEVSVKSKPTAEEGSVAKINPADFEIKKGVLIKYKGKGGTVVIPNNVRSIGQGAFWGCSSLTSITIPKMVGSIVGCVFYGCTDLEEIKVEKENPVYHSDGNCLIETKSGTLVAGCKNSKIPSDGSITCIAGEAFMKCKSLISITIPNGVTSIGEGAFMDCDSLISINIPNSVTSIGVLAFKSCSSLTSITIPSSVTSIRESVFEGCSSLTSITIPNSVTSIGESVFEDCSSLTSIIIPNSVTSIGESAFEGCSSLTSITIPNSVTSIGYRIFQGCSSLININISNSVTRIGEGAFRGCDSLTSINIPNSVTSIGGWAFYGCSSLTSISIPNGITSIGWGAFRGCDSLASITIPDGVMSIGWGAFWECKSLISITIPVGVTSIGKRTFEGCCNLTSIIIPSSVTSIGENAFRDCSSLTSITIPDSVMNIGWGAFWECKSLISITIPVGVTSIVERDFKGCSDYLKIYCHVKKPLNWPMGWDESLKGKIIWDE